MGSSASGLDRRLLELMRTRGHTPALERAARTLSSLGQHGMLWIAIGAVAAGIDRPRRAEWRSAAEAVALSYAVNTGCKLIVRRRRPTLPGLPALASAPTQLSFPSAHSATAFAGALRYSKIGLPVVPLYGLASVTALSRVYLGLHYPSDVLAGAALGSAVALLSASPRPGPDESPARRRRRSPSFGLPRCLPRRQPTLRPTCRRGLRQAAPL